ncbi:hypothetical protein C7T94_14330 [Pedobacter yulinensis]|uniref:FecR protein domain-containing protein n=1 Tax=Pedobacter yulinensis TaxID=2126353 RepID=A0A2T3HMP2_9SPHI|nr:FecR family protein [Pedobacter yulinensis]PST83699.1 hypothetical protein C7T94_14330 [Pedobacter yulinensis]
MDQDKLRRLLDKYKEGTCSPQELDELEAWYARLDHDTDMPGGDTAAQGMLADLKRRMPAAGPAVKPLGSKWYIQVAATLFVGVALAALIFRYGQTGRPDSVSLHTPQTVQARHNRFVQLPDGTRVILKEGSRLQYAASFNEKVRQVTLVGEAYFDVKHDASKPFIIHTGSVRTQVLGTAFNIKAYPEQKDIVVTVTRGKVKVSEKSRVLAVLTPNKRVVFNKDRATALHQDIEADTVVSWVRKNLAFDNESFGNVARQLADRFQVSIKIENERLSPCPTTVAFSGSENVDEALKILCLIRGASFKKVNGVYVIDGEGCTLN